MKTQVKNQISYVGNDIPHIMESLEKLESDQMLYVYTKTFVDDDMLTGEYF